MLRWCQEIAEQDKPRVARQRLGRRQAGRGERWRWCGHARARVKRKGEAGQGGTAARWLQSLAEQGDPLAQASLGEMYHEGQGVPQDYEEAVFWHRKAAEQGYDLAQFSLGIMYANGQGVPQDYAKALYWYRKAATQGHAGAQYNLGVMYEFGQGVPQDYVEAHKWYNLAASKSPPGKHRDLYVRNRDELAKRMTPAQIAEAQRRARGPRTLRLSDVRPDRPRP